MIHRTCHKVPSKFQDHLTTVVHSSSYFLDESKFFKLKSVYAIQFYDFQFSFSVMAYMFEFDLRLDKTLFLETVPELL